MAPSGKEQKRSKAAGRPSNKDDQDKSRQVGLTSSKILRVATMVVVPLSFGCASFYKYSKALSWETGDMLVRFEGVSPKTAVMNESIFNEITRDSTLYLGHDGRQLRDWSDLSQSATAAKATSDGEATALPVLKGPLRNVSSIRHFQWPAVKIGHRVEVADVPRPSDGSPPITLETINVDPPIFRIHNLFSEKEAAKLVEVASDPKNPYSVRRSTTGHLDWTQSEDKPETASTRTSDNGFDVSSSTSHKIKQRAWQLLRMSGNFDMALVDGIQILRYQQRQAYIAHMDSFAVDQSPDHNWDPSNSGTNRFATVLLYLSDVESGGQTVFPHVPSANVSPVPDIAAKLFKKNSWEDKLVQSCYSELSVQPKKLTAVLFYSQDAEGNLDHRALHGGCPVLNGTKWAANLWFWNGCRFSQCQPGHAKTGVRLPKTR
eukprot:TRINITY_DN73627_c0_g1_i1.p1 TRINITY_DN73627_c0_g1~~TRINITY_DN73627_c0_g1_i1.p1  ORF type:complete len:474 (-),score=56.80 TRINITY_DN73627_c0_g1_i1:104-1399(-)